MDDATHILRLPGPLPERRVGEWADGKIEVGFVAESCTHAVSMDSANPPALVPEEIPYWVGATIRIRRPGHWHTHIDNGPGVDEGYRISLCGQALRHPHLLPDDQAATCPRCKKLS